MHHFNNNIHNNPNHNIHGKSQTDDAEFDEDMQKLSKVLKSNQFRYPAIATVVGAVMAKSSDSVLLKAVGVAAMMLGGFKIVDSFNQENPDDNKE